MPKFYSIPAELPMFELKLMEFPPTICFRCKNEAEYHPRNPFLCVPCVRVLEDEVIDSVWQHPLCRR